MRTKPKTTTSWVAAKAEAFNALTRACVPYGYTTTPISAEEDMVRLFDSTGTPVYMVKLIPYTSHGKKKFRYDVGRELVSSPLVAITKIHNRIPR